MAEPFSEAPESIAEQEELAYRRLVEHAREVAQSSIPPESTVLVVSKGDDELLNLNGCRVWHFPRGDDGNFAGNYPEDSAAAIKHLEALRAEGAQFMLFPATAFWWLEDYAEFGCHLDKYFPRVWDDGQCIVFQLAALPPEALPIPPPELIFLVTGQYQASGFLDDGKRTLANLLGILEQNGVDIHACNAVLDFGCGCGRVARYLCTMKTRVFGTDYNSELIQWCKQNLTPGHFEQNDLAPPLSFQTGSFDLVYVLSVFTHLPELLQHAWMRELGRILRPGGTLLLTVHGDAYLWELRPEEKERFRSGRLVVANRVDDSEAPELVAGMNNCAAYHPHRYVVEELARGWQVVDFIRNAGLAGEQDAYVLQKPFEA